LITGGFWSQLTHSAAREYLWSISKTEFLPDHDISLVAQPDEVAVLPGKLPKVW